MFSRIDDALDVGLFDGCGTCCEMFDQMIFIGNQSDLGKQIGVALVKERDAVEMLEQRRLFDDDLLLGEEHQFTRRDQF